MSDIVGGSGGGGVPLSEKTPTDLTSQRTLGTWYSNETGETILVYVSVISSASSTDIRAFTHVNDDETNNQILEPRSQSGASGDRVTSTFAVPDGKRYKVEGSGAADESLNRWAETR